MVTMCVPRGSSRPEQCIAPTGRKICVRRVADVRQIVETVFGKSRHTFRLDWERPHALTGFQTRLAAKVALDNFCIWLNQQLGRRPPQHTGQTVQGQQHHRVPHFQDIE